MDSQRTSSKSDARSLSIAKLAVKATAGAARLQGLGPAAIARELAMALRCSQRQAHHRRVLCSPELHDHSSQLASRFRPLLNIFCWLLPL
jgi:hypothetical protein